MSSIPRSPYTGVQGWESYQEQGLLVTLAMAVGKGKIVEIGSEFGMSASIWLAYAPMSEITCIEINPEAPFLKNLDEAGLHPSLIHWINEDSRFVDLDKHGIRNVNLLFIDGDHSFEGARDDLIHYTPAVAIGGIMVIHDCACATNRNPHPLHHAVLSAVHHWHAAPEGQGWQFLFSVDSTMVFRKGVVGS